MLNHHVSEIISTFEPGKPKYSYISLLDEGYFRKPSDMSISLTFSVWDLPRGEQLTA